MIEQIILMCMIVGVSPVEVDCETQWLLVQDTEKMVDSPSHGWVSGLAMYDIKNHPISEFYPELEEYDDLRWISVGNVRQDYCWNEIETDEPTNCIPIIWHEIKHQICTCNWHEDLVRTFNSFKKIFGGF